MRRHETIMPYKVPNYQFVVTYANGRGATPILPKYHKDLYVEALGTALNSPDDVEVRPLPLDVAEDVRYYVVDDINHELSRLSQRYGVDANGRSIVSSVFASVAAFERALIAEVENDLAEQEAYADTPPDVAPQELLEAGLSESDALALSHAGYKTVEAVIAAMAKDRKAVIALGVSSRALVKLKKAVPKTPKMTPPFKKD